MFMDPHDKDLIKDDDNLRELNYNGVFRKNPEWQIN
jgi:hypothetical protein